jgi:hypothetical protein
MDPLWKALVYPLTYSNSQILVGDGGDYSADGSDHPRKLQLTLLGESQHNHLSPSLCPGKVVKKSAKFIMTGYTFNRLKVSRVRMRIMTCTSFY